MLNLALILFAIAALGGLALLILRIRDGNLPMSLALAHGAFAGAGLVLLILAIVNAGAGTMATLPLILFAAAAIGGFFLFSFQLRGQIIPVFFVLVHGVVAVLAFVILLKRVVLSAYGVL